MSSRSPSLFPKYPAHAGILVQQGQLRELPSTSRYTILSYGGPMGWNPHQANRLETFSVCTRFSVRCLRGLTNVEQKEREKKPGFRLKLSSATLPLWYSLSPEWRVARRTRRRVLPPPVLPRRYRRRFHYLQISITLKVELTRGWRRLRLKKIDSSGTLVEHVLKFKA